MFKATAKSHLAKGLVHSLIQLAKSQTVTHLNGISYLVPESAAFAQAIDQFLAGSRNILLLLGDAGSGKTWFCHYLMQQLLEAQSEFIPVYLPMKPEVNYQVKRSLCCKDIQILSKL